MQSADLVKTITRDETIESPSIYYIHHLFIIHKLQMGEAFTKVKKKPMEYPLVIFTILKYFWYWRVRGLTRYSFSSFFQILITDEFIN